MSLDTMVSLDTRAVTYTSVFLSGVLIGRCDVWQLPFWSSESSALLFNMCGNVRRINCEPQCEMNERSMDGD